MERESEAMKTICGVITGTPSKTHVCANSVPVEGAFCQVHSHQGKLAPADYSALLGAVVDGVQLDAEQAQNYLRTKKGNKAPKTMSSSKTTKKETTVKTNDNKKEEGIMFTLLWWMMWFTTQIEVAKDGRLFIHDEGGKAIFIKKERLNSSNLLWAMHVAKGFGDQFTTPEVETVKIKKEEKIENIPCPACQGTGKWTAPNGWVGLCVRCESKGFQTPKDVARNECYDNHGPAARAAVREAQPLNDTMYVIFTDQPLNDGRIVYRGERIQLRPETAKLGTGALLQKLYGANKIPSDAKFIWILQGNAPVKLLVKGNGRSWANYTSRPLPKSVQF
jgi:hypothetical protein